MPRCEKGYPQRRNGYPDKSIAINHGNNKKRGKIFLYHWYLIGNFLWRWKVRTVHAKSWLDRKKGDCWIQSNSVTSSSYRILLCWGTQLDEKRAVAIPSLQAMGVHIECKIVAPLQIFFLDVCHISYIWFMNVQLKLFRIHFVTHGKFCQCVRTVRYYSHLRMRMWMWMRFHFSQFFFTRWCGTAVSKDYMDWDMWLSITFTLSLCKMPLRQPFFSFGNYKWIPSAGCCSAEEWLHPFSRPTDISARSFRLYIPS